MMTRAPEPAAASEAQRLDKWLWFARVVKTRSLAAALVTDGKVRINRNRVDKPSQSVRPGDVITVAAHSRVRILKVLLPGTKRGSAVIAQTLYEDLTPPLAPEDNVGGTATATSGGGDRPAGAGRPTKRDRRALDRLTRGDP
jgi:ribosome-associated heat shock protein Hsp15